MALYHASSAACNIPRALVLVIPLAVTLSSNAYATILFDASFETGVSVEELDARLVDSDDAGSGAPLNADECTNRIFYEGGEATQRSASIEADAEDENNHIHSPNVARVADVRVSTCHPDHPSPDGFTNLSPLKLYTSGGLLRRVEQSALQVSWDDFALPEELLVAAWNVQVFGVSKMRKGDVVAELVRVLRRYDIVVVQEVRDASQTAVPALLAALNDGLDGCDAQQQGGGGQCYDVLVSNRLGATSSKEQYAWFWHVDRAEPVASWNASPTSAAGVSESGAFNRVPHAVRWRVARSGHEFSAFVLHADPDDAVAEMHALSAEFADGYEGSAGAGSDVGALLFGDFNAECNYVTASEWDCIRAPACDDMAMGLWDPSKFEWLLDDTVDTTTKATDCAYDRIVATGAFKSEDAGGAEVVAGSARVFRFDLEPEALDEDLVTRTSDHYPVEVRLSFDVLGGVDDGEKNKYKKIS